MLVLFIGIALCSYRLWRLLGKDVILERPRKWLYRKFPPDAGTAKLVNAPRTRYLGVLIHCPWCSGFWISGFVVAAVTCFVSMPLPVLWWFATSTAVGLIAKLDG